MADSKKDQTEQQTVQYLWNISRKMSLSCPAASRYYVFNMKKSMHASSLDMKGIKQHHFCEHCGSLWTATNHKVRIRPPSKKNSHIKKLLKWEAEQPWKLNNRQKKKLLKYRESSSKIVFTCLCCKKATKKPGFKRKVQTKEKMTSLYVLPSKIKPQKRDLNAGLLIHSQKKCMLSGTQGKNSDDGIISDCNIKTIDNESPSFSFKELTFTSNQPPVTKKGSTRRQCLSQDVNNTSNLTKNKKKKSLLAQILKQEQEAGKKKSGLSSFLISI